MKKIISLVKVLLKANINSSDEKKKNSKLLLLLAFGCYLLFVFSNFWKMFIDPLKEVGQAPISINLIIYLSSALLLMTSITYIVNILYFTNDMENIIPFPFKPREVFTAKLIIAYFYELMIATMLLLPGFLAYGVELGKGVAYYLSAFFVFLLLPILPIVVLTILYTVLMQFFKVNRYKNFFKIFSTVIILIAILVFQMRMNANMLENGKYDGNYILQMCNYLKTSMPYFLKVATNVFENVGSMSSILALVWYIVLNMIFTVITIWGFDKLYLRGVYNNSDTTIKTGKVGTVKYQARTIFATFIHKDIKNLFRNVTFFIQCVLPTSFMPSVILVTMMTSGASTEVKMNLNANPIIKMLFGFLIIQFFMMMNQISATAISRDGKDETIFLKSLPVKMEKQMDSKAMPSVMVGIFNLCLAMIFNLVIFTLNFWEFICLIVGGILLNLIQSYLFLMIDMKKPKLEWESEVAVVRHNANVLKAIALWFVVIIATSLIGNVFLIFNGMYFAEAFLVLLAIILIMLKQYMKKNTDKIYEKIF